jgi:hypothetical protein
MMTALCNVVLDVGFNKLASSKSGIGQYNRDNCREDHNCTALHQLPFLLSDISPIVSESFRCLSCKIEIDEVAQSARRHAVLIPTPSGSLI